LNQESTICAANSVHWYESIFRSHGLRGSIADGMWTSHDIPPPYYSNAVTLTPSPIAAQVANLTSLGTTLHRSWSVKDSFSTLELAPLGFRPLFEARWIWRHPSDIAVPRRDTPTEWRRVTTSSELERWEGAWREAGSPSDTRVFLPDLLANPAIALFAGYRGGAIVAGCAANRTDEAVGFSNFFTADADEESAMAQAVTEVARFGAGMPVVGYLAGERLERAGRLGFRTVGPLRVWLAAAR
jgi:hypothetical protein